MYMRVVLWGKVRVAAGRDIQLRCRGAAVCLHVDLADIAVRHKRLRSVCAPDLQRAVAARRAADCVHLARYHVYYRCVLHPVLSPRGAPACGSWSVCHHRTDAQAVRSMPQRPRNITECMRVVRVVRVVRVIARHSAE